MSDQRGDPLARRAAALLRSEPVDEAAMERVLARVRDGASTSAAALTSEFPSEPDAHALVDARPRAPWTQRFSLSLAPALAAAAVIFAVGIGTGALLLGPRARGGNLTPGTRISSSPVRAANELPGGGGPVEFMLVAPHAARVSLVGEFNGWDASATPMRHSERGDGTWSVSVPLGEGRHVYAFVIDDSTWVPDPQAPLAPERWFGERNSVVVVPGSPRT